jgi:hypothetical protein
MKWEDVMFMLREQYSEKELDKVEEYGSNITNKTIEIEVCAKAIARIFSSIVLEESEYDNFIFNLNKIQKLCNELRE